jgi:ribosomal protein S18 acetylase RimI-like enzyme
VLNIRPFESEDTPQLIALWKSCGLVRPQNDPTRDIARKRKVRPDLFLVGLSGAELVASVMIGYEGHRGWINYLAVSPEHRRKGFGRVMMLEAERLLRAEGCPKINLQVRTSNPEAVAFYHSIGYLQDAAISLGKRLEHDDGYEARPPAPKI